ncbi:MAG: alpha/beta hydrolase [Chloroflexi bacterium]|nr:alpha/beta hydrolase [Chloroflexota bacterium]
MNRKKIFAHMLALVALAFGLLIVLPNLSTGTIQALPQMALTEFPWLAALVAVIALIYALRPPRVNWGVAFALIALLLAAQPMLQAFSVGAALDADMRAGLGDTYLESIAPAALERVQDARFSLLAAVGARHFTARAAVTVDVPFSETPQRTLRLDVYQPQIPPAAGDTYPAIVVVHGGSWRWLDKGGVFAPHNRYLASLGYVVFDIQYRFSTEAIWPAQLQDVQCAVAWVRAHAATYSIDPAQMALLGRSAGAHLALMAAYHDRQTPADPAECPSLMEQDTSVNAVIAIYPVTDMRMYESTPLSAITALLGGLNREVPAVYAAASPVEYVRDGLPPTLLIHGEMDNLVPTAHTELLYNLLSATDTPVARLYVPWARHGFDFLIGGLGTQIVQYDLDRFLAWVFYRQT